MSSPLLSSSWYRVKGLRPKLSARVQLYRHRYRGQLWYVLRDPASGRVHRFTPAARLVIAAMDGRRTVEGLWAIANRHLGENAPTQDEMIRLLGQLHALDLLQSDVTPDAAELFDRGERTRRTRTWLSFANPMAVRLPLWDPDAFLNRTKGLVGVIWSRWGALVWLAVVIPALALLPSQWSELTGNLADRVLRAENLLVIGLVFPAVKALHEWGHAAATKAGGGEVHDVGVMLLVLVPIPYVDASASSVFRSKYQRALVGAAGMLVELFIAALAFYIWLSVEPGLVRALAFNVIIVAGISTLIFNGNPLLRYDAYYILCDLVEAPNLAPRSLDYWGYLMQRYLLGIRDLEAPELTRAERVWLAVYGVLSTAYRAFVTVVIALAIAARFFFIGVILSLWVVATMAVVPLWKAARFLATDPRVRAQGRRAVAVCAGVVAAVLGLIAVPAPFRTQAQGVVWLREQSAVRAGADGFFSEALVPDGGLVTRGTPVTRSFDPTLDAEIRIAEARVTELEASYTKEFVEDRAKAEIVAERLATERAALSRARERAEELIVRAGADGVFRLPQSGDWIGRYHRKGELLGYVVDALPPVARVVVSQAEVDQIGLATDRVLLRLAGDPERTVTGRVLRQVPAGEDHLPSKVLAVEGGGRIAVDPRDPSGTRTLARTFQLDVELPDGLGPRHFGERVYVRFDYRKTPLATQCYRAVRRLLLARFDV